VITTPIESATAHTVEPVAKSSRIAVSTRPLPNWSPSLPTIGVATEAESRNPVSSHDDVDWVVENSRASVGSAGTTSVCASA